MEVKNSASQRRQDKFRTLHQHDMRKDNGILPDDEPSFDENNREYFTAEPPPPAPRTIQTASRAETAKRDPRMDDPEYVWKLREKELLAQYGYGRRGSFKDEDRAGGADNPFDHADIEYAGTQGPDKPAGYGGDRYVGPYDAERRGGHADIEYAGTQGLDKPGGYSGDRYVGTYDAERRGGHADIEYAGTRGPDKPGGYGGDRYAGPYGAGMRGGYGREAAYTPPGQSSETWRFVPTKRSIAVKLILSGMLFGGVWIMFQLPQPWAQTGQKWVRYALSEDMQFAKVTAWYKETFSGAPSFLPTFRSAKEQESQKVVAKTTDGFVRPVRGKLLEPYSAAHPWIVVQTDDGAAVRALDTGRVVFAGDREASGFTVVVQHASGYQSTYGLLQPSGLQPGDWLEAGEPVGKVAQEPGQALGRFYFALAKELHAINPADVVAFD